MMHEAYDNHGWTPDNCRQLISVTGDAVRPGGVELTERLLEMAVFPAGSRILDAGCGMGGTTRYLARSGHLGVVGVDRSQAMLSEARRHSGAVPLMCAELEMLPFGAAQFDGVICECVLSQTGGAGVLSEFRRVLRADGLLLVSDLYRRGTGAGEDSPSPASDRRLASREQTEALLEAAGFVIEQWEDRTRDLRQLVFQLIMAPGSAGENLFGWNMSGSMCSEQGADGWCRELGYYLLLARKRAT